MLNVVSAAHRSSGPVIRDEAPARAGGDGTVAHQGIRNDHRRRHLHGGGRFEGVVLLLLPRKEDVLFEVGVMSTQSAQRAIHKLLTKPYEIETVISAALVAFGQSMARNPRELIIETILEGYRHEHRILAGRTPRDLDADMFSELFIRAKADGKLGTGVDTAHLAYLAQTMVSEGARHWAAGAFGRRSFAEVVTADICALIHGYNHRP